MGGGRRVFSGALVALIAAATLSLVPATAAQADVTVTTPEALQAELAAPTDVIQLGADIVADASTPLIVGTGTTATLDLNGHDLEITTSGTGIAVTQATLVIRDRAGGGTLTTTSGINGIAGGTATIRIEGGTIEATGSTAGIGGSNNPTVEISGGTVVAAGGSGAVRPFSDTQQHGLRGDRSDVPREIEPHQRCPLQQRPVPDMGPRRAHPVESVDVPSVRVLRTATERLRQI